MIPPGQSSALFYLYLNDAWNQPHAITAWWDNIILYKYIPVAYFVEIGDEEVVVVDDLVEPNGTESNGTDTGNDSVLTSSTFSVVPIKNYNAVIGEAFTLQVMLLNASANETYVFSDNTTLFEIGNETGLINFTPGAENNGTYGILVKAMNGSLNKTASFAMGVIEANSSDNDSGVVVETCTSLGYACVVDGGCGDGIRIYAYDVDCDIGEICCGADTGDDDITFDPYDGGDDDDDSGDGMGMVTWILIAVGALAVLGGGGFAVWKFVLAPKGILSGGEGGAVGAVSGAAMSADAQLKKLAEQG
jgi:hypothetical protein